MKRGSLSKRLFSLLLSILMVVETGITPGMTGYATEHSEESSSAMYDILAIGSPEKITVKYGTDSTKIRFPKATFALARKTSDSNDEKEDTASASSIKDAKKSKASGSETSEVTSSQNGNSRAKASKSELDSVSSKSTLNKKIDTMTDKQKKDIESLLSRSSMPEISEIEKKTGLDLKGYKVIKLSYDSWKNNLTFGEYNPQEPGEYIFEASFKNDSAYDFFNDTEMSSLTVEVLPENATPSFIYPVYVKTENVNAEDELHFEIGDLNFGEKAKVYSYDADASNREEIKFTGNTFSIPATSDRSEYYFSIETNDDEINLHIDTEGTDYQNSAGTGKEAVLLKQQSADSDLKENSFMVLGKSMNIPLTVKWEDGGRDEESKSTLTGQDIHSLLYLEYFIEGVSTEWKKLTLSDMNTKLGHSDGVSHVPSPSDSDAEALSIVFNPTTCIYNFKNSLYDSLTTRDSDTGELITHPVKYRLAPEEALSSHYYSVFEDENDHKDASGAILRNYEIKTFTATVKWRDLAKKVNGINSERPSMEAWKKHIHLHKVINGKVENAKDVNILPDSKNSEGALSITEKNSDEWLISIRGYGYDENNYPIHYYITEDAITLNDDNGSEGNIIRNRHYEAEYKNVDNASDKTDALYDGGTLVNVLAGDTDFVVNCEWKDDADAKAIEGRPAISIKLYRYAKDGKITNESRWSNLSPIQGSDYEAITESFGTDEAKKNKFYRLSLPKIGALSAYNADGAELIYTGKVKKQSKTAKYKTSLLTRSGKTGELYQGNFVLNDDTIENLIDGSITVKASKTWNAAARQDVESEVTLSLYQTTKDPGTDPSAYDISTKLPDTLKLSGFTSEIQSKSTSSVLPKYDEDGKKLYYFAREEKVATKVKDTNTGTSAYQDAVLYKENGNDYILTSDGYCYLQKIIYGGDKASGNTGTSSSAENNSTVVSSSDDQEINITNTLVGDAELLITKTFSEGLSEQDKERGYAEVSFTIYQNNRKIGKITRTYGVDKFLTEYDSKGIASSSQIKDITRLYQKFTDQILITSYDQLDQNEINEADRKKGLLPRYDERGVEYRYTAYEDSGITARGYYPTVHNKIKELSRDKTLPESVEKHIEKYLRSYTNINNSTKEKHHISVYKEWLDGGDSAGRDTVRFTLEIKKDGSWKTISENHPIDPAVDSYLYIEIPEEYEDAYKTWRENKKSGNKNSDIDFRVTETHVGKVSSDDNKVHYYTGKGSTAADDFASDPDVYLAHEWDKYKGSSEAFAKNKSAHEESDEYGLVKGDSYVYDVLLTENDGTKKKDIPQSFDFTMTNRRVGVVYLEINAGNWIDGTLKDKARPDSISLSVMMGEEEKIVTLNEENEWKASFGPFRKYDDQGELIDYAPHIKVVDGNSVNYIYSEKRKSDGEAFKGAYVLEINEDLKLKPYHTGDVYSFSLKHELKQNITPTVNKYWEDNDPTDGSSNKRPDIVMNLYRTFTDKDGGYHVEQVDKNKYISHEWHTNKDQYHNWWQLSYAPQPRFSPVDYYEYTYYIRESIPSEGTNDYVEIGAFPGSPKTTDNIAVYSYDPEHPQMLKLDDKTEVPAAKVSIDPEQAQTIVNRQRNKRTVSGVKVYNNLPSGFKAENLPKIRLELWRRAYGNDTAEPVYEYIQGKDALGKDTLILKPNGNILTTVLGSANAKGETKFYFNNTDGTRAEVPKYDDKGQLYIYTIKEVGDTEDSEESKLLHHIFKLTTNDSLTNGIVATNGYKNDTGYEITFYKKWEGLDLLAKELNTDTVKPSITVRLYRYLQNASGIIAGSDEPVTVSEAGSSKTDIVLSFDPSNPEYSSYTWKVPYYAPNLNPYVYVVSEKTGEETKGYGEIYDADIKEKTGKISLMRSEKNLYGTDTVISKIFSSKTGGRVKHNDSWTGYDTLVTGSYEINVSDDYSGKGLGTAALVNVYTGVPKTPDIPSKSPAAGPGKGTTAQKHSSDEPKTVAEDPADSGNRTVTEEPAKSGDKPQADAPNKSESKPEPEIKPGTDIKPATETKPATEIPETKANVEEPKKGSGTGSGSSTGGGSNTSGGKNTVSYSFNDSGDDNDDVKLTETTAAVDITDTQSQEDPGLRMFLDDVSDSTDMISDDDRAVLEAKRAMAENVNTDATGAGRSRSPKTGDGSGMLFYGICSLISALIAVSWYVIYKKKKM
ncbi:hypothetical protein UYO_0554 [Lachnospiraceae bacterium JC7]|nr:hypothetical protein UYO_0554 [Lachnospiraceae bacterium JC7]